MSGPIGLGDLRIILRALVDILNHQADRRAGGPALEQPRKDADPVRLPPLRGVARRAWPPIDQPRLHPPDRRQCGLDNGVSYSLTLSGRRTTTKKKASKNK